VQRQVSGRQQQNACQGKDRQGFGQLRRGLAPNPEISKWQNSRVLLTQKKFDIWLRNIPGLSTETRGRRQSAEKDATVKSKIQLILAAARRLWPEGKVPPGRNQAARLITNEGTVKETGQLQRRP